MSGYHNDQFFRINDNTGENTTFDNNPAYGNAGAAITNADNPPFIYPDRTVRTTGENNLPINTILQRGYIRSLSTYAGKGVTLVPHKCQFQFNPGSLTQVVEAASNTLDYLHLDPGQYAVPRSASVNFTFDLLFDRSMEMNNSSRTGSVLPSGDNPWESGDPSQVGVLRDLASFYGVIGQSIRADQKQYMIETLTDSLKNEAKSLTSTSDPATDTTQADLDKAISNLPAYLENNAANSAFLLPVPVRVMFSTLYMVEGFVTNTTVAFTKFSTAMVPMQCALSVTMEAKYIGFAQAKTFLTWALENAALGLQAEEQQVTADTKSLYTSMSASVNKIDVWLTDRVDADANSQNMVGEKGYKFKIHGKLPGAKLTGDDPVVKLLNSGTPPTITAQIQFAMYGPYDFTAQNLTNAELRNYVMTHGSLNGYANSFVAAGMVNGQNSDHAHAATFGEWKDMSTGFRNNDWMIGSGTFAGNPADYDDTGQFWIVNYKGTVQATIGDTTIEGTGESWELHDTLTYFPFKQTLSLSWPDYVPVENSGSVQSGTVPASNASTDPPSPGSSSSVGQLSSSRAATLKNTGPFS
jgi:hypothetical protein